MTDDLYERYKDSLRVGHVAVLRGSLNAALEAYRAAADIAPSRALPHTSLGGVLLRLGKVDEALVEFAAAVARAPQDEGALLGQAEALSISGRKVEAAEALDRVSVIQAESNRLPEAADTLRRAMEFSANEERAARQHELQRRTRLSAGDHDAEQLLARALRFRDEPIDQPSRARQPEYRIEVAPAVEAAQAESVAVPLEVEPEAEPATQAVAEAPEAEPEAAEAPAVEVEPASEPDIEVAAEIEPLPVAEPRFETEATAGTGDVAERTEHERPVEARAETEIEPELEEGALELWDEWWREDVVAPRAASAESLEDELVESDVPPAEAAPEEARPPDVTDERFEAVPSEAADVEAWPAEFAVEAEAEAEPIEARGEGLSIEAQAPSNRPESEERPEPDEQVRAPLVAVMEPTGPDAEPEPAGDELTAAAEAAETAGDEVRLRSMLLAAARAYAHEGRFEAALESAHRLLRAGPSDVDTHLVLVELYMARDWNALAQEKLALLERLATLSGDEETRKRVCGVASRAFPHDERLGSACSQT